MATYNLEEQDKLDSLKTWWDKFGTAVTIVITTLVVTIGGTKMWEYYQRTQAHQAADLYVLLQQVKATSEVNRINDAAYLLTEGFSSSGYAPRAALIAAAANIEAGETKRAQEHLQWILDNAKEEEMHDLARLRIAGVLLDEGDYDAALRQLNTKHGESYAGLYADLRGDVFVAAEKFEEARQAYQTAIVKLNKSNSYFNIVQMKLDALGDSD
ncbi:MAG: tetratricopeptide repeat protein [Betaproteobacteria bacterium]|nr:tetratricopeptide repeat protein [Betaproteobacteria bacterium]